MQYQQVGILTFTLRFVHNWFILAIAMRISIVGLLLLLLTVSTVKSQLKINQNGQPFDFNNRLIFHAQTLTLNDPKTAYSFDTLPWSRLEGAKISISHSPYTHWLKIQIRPEDRLDFIEINNPHINFLRAWVIEGDNIAQDYGLTGDNLTYSTRPLATNNFVFPINHSNSKDRFFVLMVDKRYTKLELPISLYTTSFFLHDYFSNNLLIFIFLGIVFFVFILHLYLFISVREKVYLWYCIYLICFLFALLTEAGLGFMYLYPHFPSVNDLARPIVISVSIIPTLFFFNNLLQIKNNAPKFYRYNLFIIYLYALLAVLAVLTSIDDQFRTQGIWLTVQRILAPTILLLMIFQAYRMYRMKIPLSIFVLISLIAATFFIGIFILYQIGVFPYVFIGKNALFMGLSTDAMIMSLALTWRFRLYKKQAEESAEKQKKYETRLLQEITNLQQQEMANISSMLHDNLGARMGLFRLEIEKIPLDEPSRKFLTEQIISMSQEIRQISHGLSPLLLQDKGLYNSILHSIQRISITKEIQIQFEWMGNKTGLPPHIELIVYRIAQELLQNMIKHAQAKQVILQVIVHEDLVSIYYEDDGIGTENWKNNSGAGIKTLLHIAELLSGIISIESSVGNGFNVSVEFKLTPHEIV
jgi:signal transduction histidine kinase